MNNIINTAFENKYTYLEFNVRLFDKFEYLYYYISKLKDDIKPISIVKDDWSDYFNFIDKTDVFNNLLNRVNNYLKKQ